MRNPLDTMIVTNPFKQAGYGVFGVHAGLDLRANVGTNVYAPTDGVITERYIGSNGIQVLSMRIGDKEWRFLHLSSMFPTVGESVKEGQLIAKSGNSGNVAAHLHVDIRKAGTAWNRSINDYFDPAIILPMNKVKQGDTMATIITDAHIGILRIAHSEIGGWNLDEVHAGKHDATFLAAWKGKTIDELIWAQWGDKNAQSYRSGREANKKKIVELQTALTNELNKPAKEVVKEVVKIVEKPVEVVKIKEVPMPVDEKAVVKKVFTRFIDSLFKK